jgi:hypothetical protein
MLLLPALQTVRHAIHWNILVTCQGFVTSPAAEMLDMPEPVLCPRIFIRKYQLITSSTAGNVHEAGKVPGKEELPITEEIKKIFQHFTTFNTRKACWMPTLVSPSSLSKNSNLTGLHVQITSRAKP